MSYLLHEGEQNLFSELRDAGYYVWMNARNDLFAGQEPEWVKANADEIFYGGDLTPPPGPIYHPNNQKEGDKDLYSLLRENWHWMNREEIIMGMKRL